MKSISVGREQHSSGFTHPKWNYIGDSTSCFQFLTRLQKLLTMLHITC